MSPKPKPEPIHAPAAAAPSDAASNPVEKPEPVAPVAAEPPTVRTQDRPTDPASRAAWKRARGIALGEPHSQ